mmetsp:Transcript_9521/g.13962  ORF Transcript_9521/g.13962 Transcript_9521/m.13962 type:complete len:349 (-) Transcript_9521:516-1562(-)|eukprot:CAMPEP_0195525322 /NCGR_PEP_ID=MMETSP0794_2-20130614/25720_1 /TAXON_ID=515487 /ORGANISM="Stephanopyxis turris, Strain CCMP 815" /LENGTH=348 /DNA_ID=CAMNT_0040655763 /DNA_START=93 /DNA_END=1139 /DNA_ORIENTATION=-
MAGRVNSDNSKISLIPDPNNSVNDSPTRPSFLLIARNSVSAGSMAGITSTLMFHPLDLLRVKLQTTALTAPTAEASVVTSRHTAFQMFTRTVRMGGFKSLYTGLSFPLAAQALYKAVVFSTNEITRSILMEFRTKECYKAGIHHPPLKLGLTDTFFCGAIAGSVNASLFVTPVELVRNVLIAQQSKLMLQSVDLRSKISLGTTHLKGPMDVVRKVLKHEGVVGLWRGANVTIMRDALGCGMFFVMFDLGKKGFTTIVGEKYAAFKSIAGGAIAGIGYWAVALPLDTVKTLVQTRVSSQSTISIIKELAHQNSMSGLYKGWEVSFGRGVPAAAVTVATYDFCIRLLLEE